MDFWLLLPNLFFFLIFLVPQLDPNPRICEEKRKKIPNSSFLLMLFVICFARKKAKKENSQQRIEKQIDDIVLCEPLLAKKRMFEATTKKKASASTKRKLRLFCLLCVADVIGSSNTTSSLHPPIELHSSSISCSLCTVWFSSSYAPKLYF